MTPEVSEEEAAAPELEAQPDRAPTALWPTGASVAGTVAGHVTLVGMLTLNATNGQQLDQSFGTQAVSQVRSSD